MLMLFMFESYLKSQLRRRGGGHQDCVGRRGRDRRRRRPHGAVDPRLLALHLLLLLLLRWPLPLLLLLLFLGILVQPAHLHVELPVRDVPELALGPLRRALALQEVLAERAPPELGREV